MPHSDTGPSTGSLVETLHPLAIDRALHSIPHFLPVATCTSKCCIFLFSCLESASKSWQVNEAGHWIEADFGAPIAVTGLVTQGDEVSARWVTKYILRYQYDHDAPWRNYEDPPGITKVDMLPKCSPYYASFYSETNCQLDEALNHSVLVHAFK